MGGRAAVLLAGLLLIAVTTIYHTQANKHVLSLTPRTQWNSWALNWPANEEGPPKAAKAEGGQQRVDLGRKAFPSPRSTPSPPARAHRDYPPAKHHNTSLPAKEFRESLPAGTNGHSAPTGEGDVDRSPLSSIASQEEAASPDTAADKEEVWELPSGWEAPPLTQEDDDYSGVEMISSEDLYVTDEGNGRGEDTPRRAEDMIMDSIMFS